ncbi:BlaI/MecI/CopY family transcriptional regulator [Kribbella ginsengisoli]
MTDRGGRRGAGELEGQVMAALWSAELPLTTAEVHAKLGDELAYNTVQTILARLTAKSLVQRATRGRAHVYWPTKNEAASIADQLRTTLSGVQNRALVLREFAAGLDDDEAETLQRWLSARSEDNS